MEITKNITKNSIKIGKTLILLGILLWMYNCSTSSYTPTKRHKNLSYLYNESEAFLHPSYQIYNFSKDSSVVFIKLPVSDLLVKDLGAHFDKYGLVKIHYRLYESLSTGGLIDSVSFSQKLITKPNNTSNTFSFRLKTPNYQKTYLSIKLTDIFSERTRKDYLEIDKTRSVNRQSFLLKETQNKELIFGNELLINKVYEIQSPLLKTADLYIQEQNIIKSIPNIPSSTQRSPSITFISDTSYKCNHWEIQQNRQRITFLTFDTTKIKGVAFYFYDSIPNYIHSPSQMLEPLSYLLSPKKYQILLQDSNPKFALDKFWLKTAGNIKHAKEMIKVYYHRVNIANKYFSSYKMGWMTDRGMIYIVYGEPTKIYKSQSLERWIYGSIDSDKSLTFDFDKVRNPFSDNNFLLVKDESYKQSWAQAIDAWRNGRIYSIAK